MFNSIEKIEEEFKKRMKEQTFTPDDYIESIIEPIIGIIKDNKDKTPEELTEIILDNTTMDLTNILQEILNSGNNTLVPGYTFNISVGDIKCKIYGGNFSNHNALTNDAIFDIASITKMYTQVICYNLANDGYFSLDTKIGDLDPRFINLKDLTIRDLTTFSTSFNTPGRIDDQKSTKEALDVLYNTTSLEKGKYNYNDIGMMVLKEVMESASNEKYEDLFKKYILDKMNLHETHLILPQDKIPIFTGSANDSLGLSNDAKAIMVGGFSGHAGVKATAEDLLRFAKAPFMENGIVPEQYIKDLLTLNAYREDGARSEIGSAKTANPFGLDKSDSPLTAPKTGFSAYGSTRVQTEAGRYKIASGDIVYGSTVMLNPSSISPEKARELEDEINKKRMQYAIDNKTEYRPISILKEYSLNGQKYNQISSPAFLSFGASTDKMVTKSGEAVMRLLFLQDVMAHYEKDYSINHEEEIHLSR